MDVKMTFIINGNFNKEVCIERPKGFDLNGDVGRDHSGQVYTSIK